MSSQTSAKAEQKWLDKDFVLHSTGFHHFHLGNKKPGGSVARTRDVLFAVAARHEFTVVGVFAHSVFERGSDEQLRLLSLHERITMRDIPPGTVVLTQPITTSGHRLSSVARAQDCMRGISNIDPYLEDPNYLSALYAIGGGLPKRPRPEWYLHHLDFGILDRSMQQMFVYREGYN